MTKKPTGNTHKYKDFVEDVIIDAQHNKRYSLELIIDNEKTETIIVIMKNPSKATKEISDATINRVSTFIHNNVNQNLVLNNVGKIVILNLIPYYETESEKLQDIKYSMIDFKNLESINHYCSTYKNVIIAWGDRPKGLFYEYVELKKFVLDILERNKNDLYYVESFSNSKNPRHGLIWEFAHFLKKV
jgi:hypothetical protein